MKKNDFESIKDAQYGKLSAEGMKKVVGGFTLNTVTVTPDTLQTLDERSSNGDDGDDSEEIGFND